MWLEDFRGGIVAKTSLTTFIVVTAARSSAARVFVKNPGQLRSETRRSCLETVANLGEHLISGNGLYLAGSQFGETSFGNHHPFDLDFGQRWIDRSEQRIYDHDPFFNGKAFRFFD